MARPQARGANDRGSVRVPLKPRIVLAALLLASAAGTTLAWQSRPAAAVGSWLLVVSFGALAVGGSLEIRRGFPGGRWGRLEVAGGVAVVAGAVLRVAGGAATTGPSGTLLPAVAAACALTILAGRVGVLPRWPAVALAAAGLLALAWADGAARGDAPLGLFVRTVHLVSVGAWIGGAVWHNAVAVPAIVAEDGSIRPVVGAFQRFVPLLVAAVFPTGLHQAATGYGTVPSAYLGTSAGHLVVGKLLLFGLLAALVAGTVLRKRGPN